MIIEFEDFIKWLGACYWDYVKTAFEDKEPKAKILKNESWETTWFLVRDFAEAQGVEIGIIGPDGDEITDKEYYQLVDKIQAEVNLADV